MSKLGPYELNTAVLGDCLDVMRRIPDNSVSSIVTDPPYGLGNDPDMVELLTHWLNDKDYDTGPGFMNRSWDIVPGPNIWRECFRVLKPGGCLMAFGGTRTCDLLSVAIRLAGFQRFDSLVWLHSQGFAKGADISKKLDELAGAEREVIGQDEVRAQKQPNGFYTEGRVSYQLAETPYIGNHDITAPATEAAKLWSGFKTQLKPAHEVILCFWKPREKSYAENALKWGVSGLNIDGCRIATGDNLGRVSPGIRSMHNQRYELGARPNNYYEDQKSRWIDNTKGQGRYPSNCLISHDPRCVRVGVKRVRGSRIEKPCDYKGEVGMFGNGGARPARGIGDPDGYETVEEWACVPSCPVRMLDDQAGERKGSPKKWQRGNKDNGVIASQGLNKYHRNGRKDIEAEGYGDSGSASRFFYTPKAPPREKWFYCEICDDVYPYAERDDHAHDQPKGKRKHQIAHPTVKPVTICNYALNILEYLCRLTKTPTGGIVLDPFGGSGTTALAAIANGRDFLIIENDPIYHRIAQKRIEQAMSEPKQLGLLK